MKRKQSTFDVRRFCAVLKIDVVIFLWGSKTKQKLGDKLRLLFCVTEADKDGSAGPTLFFVVVSSIYAVVWYL